jgi:hypothetical protein
MTNAATLGSFGDVGGSPLVFRNKIINGDMIIYQRQAAATASGIYATDRWQLTKSNGATESLAPNTDAPTGFSASLRNTISVGDASIGATEYSAFNQSIEGVNTSDLAWGTSSAKSVTLSFWVRSSVIGQYTANLRNLDASRICPFNYTINVANTWEHQKITLPGCLDGVWNAGTTSTSITVQIYPALGSSYLGGTAGVWNSTGKYGSGTPVNAIASNGNIFAITGVQLEAGTCATPFERLLYSQTLSLCQRYYIGLYGRTSGTTVFGQGLCESSTVGSCLFGFFPTTMRVEPAASIGAGLQLYGTIGAGINGTFSSVAISEDRSSTTSGCIYFSFTGAYVGGSYVAYTSSTGIKVAFNAEL